MVAGGLLAGRGDASAASASQHAAPADRSAVRYDGSLTTPPCSAGVEWLVLAEPVQTSTAQVDAFRALHDRSARPVQPRYDRAVLADVGRDRTATARTAAPVPRTPSHPE